MTSAVEPISERTDVRTIVGSGIFLGVLTAIGVVTFSLLSRVLSGTTETIVQAAVVLVGAAVASYLPAARVRPQNVDSIAWAALVGLLGALVFTVADAAVLRPLKLYHWRWDAIGGGSGFWYIPVWWMGAAVLAWLGSWVAALVGRAKGTTGVVSAAGLSAGLALLILAVAVLAGVVPFTAATMALAFAVALVVHVGLASILFRT
jgi:hypothetical protein